MSTPLKGQRGWMVSLFSIVMIIILSVTVLSMSTRITLFFNQEILSFETRQAEWNRQSAQSVTTARGNKEAGSFSYANGTVIVDELCAFGIFDQAVKGASLMTLTSEDFNHGQPFDAANRASGCGGGSNHSPKLAWGNVPTEARSFVMLMEDPDISGADNYVHWAVYNIPTSITSVNRNGNFSNPAAVLPNSAGNSRYDGPCPPVGQSHRYVIKIYALNIQTLTGISNVNNLKTAMTGKIVGFAQLMGIYHRTS